MLIVGIVVAALIGIMALTALPGMGAVRRLTVNAVDLSGIPDGVYPGSFRAGRFSFAVEVTVRDHRILAARSSGREGAQDSFVRQILQRIVEKQSVKVDTVSGASLTTKAVSKAVENALTQAH